jgi:hypothetical protein
LPSLRIYTFVFIVSIIINRQKGPALYQGEIDSDEIVKWVENVTNGILRVFKNKNDVKLLFRKFDYITVGFLLIFVYMFGRLF